MTERIIQFGTGRLLRGFADFFIHRANEQGLFDGHVVCIQSTGIERAKALNDRDGRFNLWTRGIESGHEVDRIEEIRAISRAIPASENWTAALAAARDPNIQSIISNASEVAVVLDHSDRVDANPPRSFPGKLTALLFERARAFDFAEESGLVVLPCELLEDNGEKLREIVLELGEIWSLGNDFLGWVSTANLFCNTLVDRIVTGRPSESDLEIARSRIGYDDPMITVTEPYRLWAIEGDARLAGRLKFLDADPGIVVADDIAPYRERKLRLLNGGHTLTVPLGILLGNRTVLDNSDHPETGPFIEALLRDEIGPTVPVEPSTISPFIDEVLDRWRNPFLDHQLRDIAWQSTSKMKARVIPTIKRYFDQFATTPPLAARGFAAYLILMRPEYGIDDDLASILRGVWASADDLGLESIREVVGSICSHEDLWDTDLKSLPGFADEVARNVTDLLDRRLPGGERPERMAAV